ncbi:hypothetical protein BOTBODRAFT_106143 [Botryobasidium botryosum FD-172 SS1]|uniref:DDE Tnp4 domain-containing protein n=1 Tax=Botryobasidium botryosum (strain FD-172 SS1) TaxID=930990 RepID=A0A067MQH1_BOTB1|nr:hypothetical protein BOTBODRAFT_106143 [Botryobasidium botryosum FD-172 SS1]
MVSYRPPTPVFASIDTGPDKAPTDSSDDENDGSSSGGGSTSTSVSSDSSDTDDTDSNGDTTSVDSDDSGSSSETDTPGVSDLVTGGGDFGEGDSFLGEWEGFELRKSNLARYVREEIEKMYKTRYELPRNERSKPTPKLPHLLNVTKNVRPDQFRRDLRVSPLTFDRLVDEIIDSPVFANKSEKSQMPVETQLAITLYRFGHDGNAASLDSVADWAGVGKGTVLLCTRRVMAALLSPGFLKTYIRMPTAEEKEEAKEWVESRSCKEWRNGWCMVDGTLTPLEYRPHWYGESYYDRKSNYSLNFQIVSLPNLRIIDVGFGHTGSTHDSTAWEDTYFAKNIESLLEEDEWIWVDSAYTVSVHAYARGTELTVVCVAMPLGGRTVQKADEVQT